jgi:hypothetical protein
LKNRVLLSGVHVLPPPTADANFEPDGKFWWVHDQPRLEFSFDVPVEINSRT